MARVLRKRTRVCYYEPEEPSFDEYIYCTSCRDYVYEYCSIHGPLLVVPDDKVPSPTGYPPIVPRAALTIPKVFLHLAESDIPGGGIGVFSTLTLPVGVRFGPYRGARAQTAGSRYCWQIFNREHKPSCLVDAGDADRSNWMRYVNCSRHEAEQNLVAYQYQGQIYYRTIKIVPRFTELLVFYGSEFALALDVDLRRYRAPRRGPQINVQDQKLDENENIPTSSDKEERKDKFSENLHGSTPGHTPGIGDDNASEDIVCKKPKPTTNGQGTQQVNNNESKNVVGNKTYTCNDCGRSYKEKASLICHTSTHKFKENVNMKATSIGVSKYPCETCDSKFVTKSELINHNIKEHESKIKYKACDQCNYKTILNSNLKCHMRIHTGSKPYQCTVCDSKFNQHASLKTHLRTHTGEKPYQCTVCDSKFNRKAHLETHLRTHNGEKPYQCTVCDSKFIRKAHLETHLRTHNGEKPYQCTVCDSKFNRKAHLETHLRTHNGEKPYQCTVCDSKFNQQAHLKTHLRTHTGEKPYQCTVCDSKFNQQAHLETHLRTHNGEKPYQCTVCDSKFNRKAHLETHLRTHTGEKPYQCTVCDSKFNQQAHLETHLRTHNGEKPYQCTVCDSKFNRKAHLETHLRTHNGEKPYQCTVCDAKFSDNSNLKKHLRTHIGKKP